MSGDGWYLLGWVGFIAVNVVAIYGAWWALFSDHGKKLRRCPRCWHDLSHTPGMTCGECGHTAPHERAFHRRRRRPVVALGAIVASVLSVVLASQYIGPTGLVSTAPTRVLVMLLPFGDSANGVIFRELDRRMNRGLLSDGEWTAVVNRWVEGDWGARPPSTTWQTRYGSRITAWRNQLTSNSVWRDKLLELPPQLTLATRAVWPADAPVRIDVLANDWWPAGTEMLITATPRLDGETTPTRFRRTSTVVPGLPFSLPAPPLPEGDHELTYDFTIQRQLDGTDEWASAGETSASVTVRIRGALTEQLTPKSSPEMDAAMAAVFRQGWTHWAEGPSPVRILVDGGQTSNAVFDDTAVGARVELFRDGVLARQLDLWWLAGRFVQRRGNGWERAVENIELLRTADNSGAWTMRVTGDPTLALRAGEAKHYWSGTFTMPATFRHDSSASPPVPWQAEHELAREIDPFIFADEEEVAIQ